LTALPGAALEVPVAGGALYAVRWGVAPTTVLAVHGITATHLAWVEVARLLPDLSVLAPDLRGRGRSATLPGPYGFDAHVADLLAVLDAAGCERAVLVAHSMGGFVAVALAAAHPERVSRLVLVDGGLPTGRPEDPPPPGGIDAVLGPAAARLGMTFPTREAYREFWRSHAALGPIWGPVVQAYVDYDLVGEAPQFRSSCREEAMRVDGAAVIDHAATTTAMRSLRTPAAFLRAERGLQGVPPPLYSEASVARWRDGPPFVEACTVPDTDHYSILLGAHGAAVVAAAVTAAATTSA
jgi:lipase